MPRIIYKNSKGKRLPSVTTILSNLGWSKDALMYWAWNEGIEGRDYKDTSGKAADIGTIAHAWVEAEIKGEKFNIDEFDLDNEAFLKVNQCHNAYKQWQEHTKLKLLEAEISLTSEQNQFGGTIDCVGYIYNRKSLVDLKTGGIFDSHVCQLAGYAMLWKENRPNHPLEEIHILRLGKEDGSFTHRMIPIDAMKPAFDVFQSAIVIHKNHKAVTNLK